MRKIKFKKIELSSQTKRLDFSLLLTVLILVIFGLMMVYDASAIQALRDFKDSLYYIRQQLIWVAAGVASMVFFTLFDYRKFRTIAFFLMIFSILLLLAVFIPGLGVSGGGAHRWLRFGSITIQPAEILKLTGVIYLSVLFQKTARIIPFLALLLTVTLITAVLQKDLGSTIVFIATGIVLYISAGGGLRYLFLSLPFGIAGIIGLILTSGYRSKRVLAMLDPFSDPQGYTYHISQVLIALGSGGLFGLGLGHSRQKFEYIPEVSTDSIFGIIGEELGFLGGSLVIILFALLVIRGFKIAEGTADSFGRILALGLISWLGIQAIVNLSSMTALMPLTGVPLPFISYGGSALVANLTAVGILLNISRQSNLN